MSLQKKFNKFNTEIMVSWQNEKMKEIREKNEGETGIEKQIKEKFKENGYSVKEVFNQGSYATNMSIIPHKDEDYDIDRGIVIDEADAPEDPREVKKVLRDVLKNRNLKDPKIKKPCVTAQYYEKGEEKFHIDYPIYKKDSNDKYFLAIGKEYSSESDRLWEEVDIKGLIKWLNAKNSDVFFENLEEEECHQYKRLVRYMKQWRNNVFKDSNRKHIYSVGLNVMIKEELSNSISHDGDIDDLEALYNTVKNILNNNRYFSCSGIDNNGNFKYDLKVNLPKLPYIDIFRKHGAGVGTIFKQKLEKLKKNLEDVRNETDLEKQCNILRDKVFGEYFPKEENIEKNTKNQTYESAGFVGSPQGA